MIETFAGRFLLLRRLGQGGMGEVFLARDLSTGSECALKRLSPAAAALPDLARHEFEALTRIRHPLLVAVHEFGASPEGVPYCTMEYVPGVPSHRAIARGDWAGLCYLGSQIALGLEFLHSVKIGHGDLKPANVLVVPADEPGDPPRSIRLLDFGLAGMFEKPGARYTGTPGYAAPEVSRGEAVSVATDLYGLGATLYEIACGRAALEAGDMDSLLRRQQSGPPSTLPLEEAGVPDGLAELILKLMAPEPRERPTTAREVRNALGRLHPAARRTLGERLQATLLVGRERELARLESWWSAPTSAKRLKILTGEAGAGKSALLAELNARAALAGLDCVALSCGAVDAPGGVARVLLKRLAAFASVDLANTLSPALARAVRAEEEPLREDDLDALAQAGTRCAYDLQTSSRSVLVLLDDTERIDRLSAAWIRRLICSPEAGSLRMIRARRAGDQEQVEDQTTLVAAGFAEIIELGVLDRESIERLAAARLNGTPGDVLVEFLWAKAGGHAGLTVELLKAAAVGGAIVEDDDGLRVHPDRLRRVVIPADFESLLELRYRALSDSARAWVDALAVWGKSLRPEDAMALLPELDPADVEAVVDTGLARRLPDGGLLLWPPAFATRILSGIPSDRRRELHARALERQGLTHAERFRHLSGLGRVAAALESAEAALTEAPDIELAAAAADLAIAVSPQRAAQWHERVARLLMRMSRRYAAAIPHLEKALEIEPPGEARGAHWAGLGTCLLRCGRLDDMERLVREALSEGVPEKDRLTLQADDAARLLTLGRLSEGIRLASEVHAAARSAGEDITLGVCADMLAKALLIQRKTAEAEPLAQEGRAAFERAGDLAGQVRSFTTWATIARARNDLEEAERICREGLAFARAGKNRMGIEEALGELALMLSLRGRWEAARECYAEALRLAIEDARASSVAGTITNLGYMAGLMGDVGQARDLARRAMPMLRRHRPRILGLNWRSLSQALRASGRYRAALRAAHRAIAFSDRSMPDERIWSRLELGRVKASAGNWNEASEVWRSVAEPLTRESPVENTILRAFLGRAALRDGRRDDAVAEAEALRAWLMQHEAPYAAAHHMLLVAEIAVQNGSPDAGDLASRVLDSFTALSAVPDRAGAALELARLAPSAPANASLATQWLRVALQDFERMRNVRGRLKALGLMLEWQKHAGGAVAMVTTDRGLIERVSWLLNSITDLSELSQRALRMAVEQLNAERGAVLMLDRESGQFTVVAEQGAMDAAARNQVLGFSRQVVQRVTESGGSLLIRDAQTDPRARSDSIINLQLLSILCVPLFSGSTITGAVYLDDSRRAHTFEEPDRRLLEGFAQLMAVAIEKARGHEEIERFRKMLEDENIVLRQEVGARFQYQNVVGTSSLMKRVMATVAHAARTNTTILITGENGTGKELIARTLHHGGRRKGGPFRSVNCGAITEGLLESELFGILSNVATGVRERKGMFVQADGGTLFLDEVGEMPLRQQVALLSALANREITPVGGSKPIPVDVRIIAASNKNLRLLVEQGLFREDLFYRLSVLEIDIPPLRERKSDIPALAHHFLAYFSKAQEREVPELSPDFMAVLTQSDWPGNVRELQNYIERVLAVNPGKMLRPDPLPRDLQDRAVLHRPGRGRRLADTVGDIERRMLVEALERSRGNQSEAARILGLTEQSIRYRIRKYGMGPARDIRRTRK
jgi:transcriptional regulator with GAF, ATPase, and Fis domain/tetratricopeptide (TPR) repeat protein